MCNGTCEECTKKTDSIWRCGVCGAPAVNNGHEYVCSKCFNKLTFTRTRTKDDIYRSEYGDEPSADFDFTESKYDKIVESTEEGIKKFVNNIEDDGPEVYPANHEHSITMEEAMPLVYKIEFALINGNYTNGTVTKNDLDYILKLFKANTIAEVTGSDFAVKMMAVVGIEFTEVNDEDY